MPLVPKTHQKPPRSQPIQHTNPELVSRQRDESNVSRSTGRPVCLEWDDHRWSASRWFGPETSDRNLANVIVIIIGTDEEHPVDVCCGPEREGIAKRWRVAKFEVGC